MTDRTKETATNDESPVFDGLHHVRLPVSDVLRSRDWYASLFGFEPLLCFEEETHVVGVVVGHGRGPTLGLHEAPHIAAAMRGFCCLALNIGDRENLDRWCRHLDNRGIDRSDPEEGHLGWYVEVCDPDGIVVRLHTSLQPSADEA